MEKTKLSSLSETVRQLLLDGAEVRGMEDRYMCSIMYPGKTLSYIVAHMEIPFTSKEDLLTTLQQGLDVISSLRFY